MQSDTKRQQPGPPSSIQGWPFQLISMRSQTEVNALEDRSGGKAAVAEHKALRTERFVVPCGTLPNANTCAPL